MIRRSTVRLAAAGPYGRGRLALCLVLLLGAVPAWAQGAEYRLQAGDVIEVSVAGAPDMQRRVAIQLDGSLPIPLAGRVAAAGATLAEVEARIQSALASRPFRNYTADGRESLRFIDREQISVAVVEYRPVSIAGAVAQGGEHPFRPGMTVRHLIAAAGGFGRPEAVQTNQAARLNGEYAVAWIALATQQARLSRVRAELGEDGSFDASALPPPPMVDQTLEHLLRSEAEYRATRASDHAREKAYLSNAIAQADVQIAALAEQQAQEEAGVEADTEEMQRTQDLRNRGMATQSRVIDARRVLLFSSTRALQTAAQLGSVRRQRSELERDLNRADDRLRVRLLAELQEVLPEVATARARLASITEQLQAAGLPVPTSDQGEPTIVLVRTGQGGTSMLLATMHTPLQPGDVVEIRPVTAPPLQGEAMVTTSAATVAQAAPAMPAPTGTPPAPRALATGRSP